MPDPAPTSAAVAVEPDRDVALDGMRGLAILLVVLYHVTVTAPPQTMPGRLSVVLTATGWSGVDMFFVLSGFLITRILYRERAAPRYFSAFYARRVLRILPLYYVVVAVVFWAPAWIPGIASYWLAGADRTQFWYWLHLSNVHVAQTGRFHHLFLSVTWSLAIEEQFYLVWPLCVRLLSATALERVCATIVVVSPLMRAGALAMGVNPLAVYALTPFRFDGLAIGCWLALRTSRSGLTSPLRLAHVVGPLAAVLSLAWLTARAVSPGLGGAMPDIAHPVTQIALYSSLPLAYGALLAVLLAAPPTSRWRRVFAFGPLRTLGIYSYAVYLLHLPVIEAIDHWVDPAAVQWPTFVEVALWGTMTVLGSLAAAMVSWRLLEGPALRLRRFFPYGSPPVGGTLYRSRSAVA